MTTPIRTPKEVAVKTQFGWISGGNIIASATQALSFILLARWAGPEEFGLISSILALIFVLQTLSDLGIAVFLTRIRAANPNDDRIRRALGLNTLTAGCLAIAASAMIAIASVSINTSCLQLLPLALWSAADRNTDTRLGILIADGDARINAASIVARRVAAIAAFVALYAVGMPTLLAYSLGCCVVACLANIWARRIVECRIPPCRSDVSGAEIIREARPFWVASVAAHGRNIDVLIVGAIAGSVQAAYYAAASRTTGPLRLLPSSLATVLVPAVARPGGRVRAALVPAAGVLGFVMAMYLALIILAPILVPYAIGSDFAGAVPSVQIVVAGRIFAAAASIIGAVLQGMGSPKVVAAAGVVATGACIVGVVVGASVAGSLGAAISLSMSFVLQAVILAVSLLRRLRRPKTN